MRRKEERRGRENEEGPGEAKRNQRGKSRVNGTSERHGRRRNGRPKRRGSRQRRKG